MWQLCKGAQCSVWANALYEYKMTLQGAEQGEIRPGKEGEWAEFSKCVSLKAGKQAQTPSL